MLMAVHWATGHRHFDSDRERRAVDVECVVARVATCALRAIGPDIARGRTAVQIAFLVNLRNPSAPASLVHCLTLTWHDTTAVRMNVARRRIYILINNNGSVLCSPL